MRLLGNHSSTEHFHDVKREKVLIEEDYKYQVIIMSEIKIEVPEEIPLSSLKRKIDELIKEEEMKWALFEKCKEELSLTEEDLDELEKIREESWKKIKKKYEL